MIDDIETKGYRLPYLGIKPTAAGVAPVMPIPHMPSVAEIPPMPQPVKVPASQKTAHTATPMPISQPKMPSVPQPIKTTQAPISNVQWAAPTPPQKNPPAPQIYRPMNFSTGGMQDEYEGEQDVNFLPQSLQPQPPPLPEKKPTFNQLTNLLNRR